MNEIDAVYEERNRVVAALARVMLAQGHTVAVGQTDIPGWDAEWHGCVYIDGPVGQMSWHFHDREAHLFDGLPRGNIEWDGHSTPEKYERLAALGPQRNTKRQLAAAGNKCPHCGASHRGAK